MTLALRHPNPTFLLGCLLTAVAFMPQAGATQSSSFSDELPPALRDIKPQAARGELFYDWPGDGALWVRGDTFKACFGPEGTTYIPFFGSDAPRNFPITFRSPELAVGGVPLGDSRGPVDAQRVGDTVEYSHQAMIERYDLAADSMEQLLVLDRPQGHGEATFFFPVETELQAAPTPSGGLRFENEYGHVDYSRAIAIDAEGDRLALHTTWTGAGIEIRVPADFLAVADYPVTVDPVLTVFSVNDGDYRTFHPDVAYDRSWERYLIVYEIIFSGSDHDVYAVMRAPDGTDLGFSYAVDLTNNNWIGPRVANNNLADNFLVVAQQDLTATSRVGGRLLNAGSNSMSPQLTISSSNLGTIRHVDVGGDPVMTHSTSYCVVWEVVFSENLDHSVFAVHVDPLGTVLNQPMSITETSGTVDGYPRISNSNGGAPRSTQNWNVVFSRRRNPGDWDVRGAQIHADGGLTTPSFSIDGSASYDQLPTASSPLDDDGGGERTWMAVYSRADSGPDTVQGSVLRGGTSLWSGSLTAIEGTHQGQRKQDPVVDSDGRGFLVAYSERVGSSATDFSVYLSTFYWNGTFVECPEAHVITSTDTDHDYQPALCAAFGADGPRREAACIWTDANIPTDDYDLEGGIYLAADLPLGEAHCSSVPNSSGLRSEIWATGSPFISDRDITLRSYYNPSNVVGLFFFGTSSIQVPFGDGYRCVGGSIQRMYRIASTDVDGVATREVDWSKGYAASIVPGHLYFQYWFRDTAAGQSGFNLSDSFHARLLP